MFTLAVCALSDLAAVPLLLSASGSEKPPAAIAALIAVIGVVTGIAAVGLSRGSPWARPTAIGTRLVDGIAALAGLGAGDKMLVAAAGITLALSVAAIVLVLRSQAVPEPATEVPRASRK